MIINHHIKQVRVDWVDSVGAQGGWQFLDECNSSVANVTTYGFLIKETEGYVVIAQSYSPASEDNSEQVNGVIAIPKVAISALTYLAPEKEPTQQQL